MVWSAAVLTEGIQVRRQIVSLDVNSQPLQMFTPILVFVEALPKPGTAWGGIGLVTLMLSLAILGCSSDAQNIRATNEAAATPEATSAPISAEIRWTEIRDGDCISSKLSEGINLESVAIVPCSQSWQYRALNSLVVQDRETYPGEDLFRQRAYEECDRRYSFVLFPAAISWTKGDRLILCLQDDFGLSETDPAKLDRLVSSDKLKSEECFNAAPETGDSLVELVDCSGEWQYRTLSNFAVDDAGPFPGDSHFRRTAFSECDRRYTISLNPTEHSWSLGDRRVICLQEDFGLSAANPSKLDRLFVLNGLKLEECFNEAPETGYARVELVNCPNGWEFQVVDRFSISLDETFPGDEYLEEKAGQECSGPFDFYYSPTAETWEFGDRTITCVQAAP